MLMGWMVDRPPCDTESQRNLAIQHCIHTNMADPSQFWRLLTEALGDRKYKSCGMR